MGKSGGQNGGGGSADKNKKRKKSSSNSASSKAKRMGKAVSFYNEQVEKYNEAKRKAREGR